VIIKSILKPFMQIIQEESSRKINLSTERETMFIHNFRSSFFLIVSLSLIFTTTVLVTEVDDSGKEIDKRNIITFPKNPKLNLLIDVINNIPPEKKIIIWTSYVHAVERGRSINKPFLDFLQNHPYIFQLFQRLFQRLGL